MLEALSLHPHSKELQRRLLASARGEKSLLPRISLFLPAQTPDLSVARRKFRFIRMVKRAEKVLASECGHIVARQTASGIWESNPLQMIEDSPMPLAVFHEPGFTGAMHLPIEVPERLIVAESYHVKPVLQWLQSSPHYFLICLSARQATLYEGTAWELRRIREFGQATEADGERIHATKESVRQFFLKVQAEIEPIFNRSGSPVVMAGVAWLHPIFRRVNRSPNLIQQAIRGSVERWSPAELRMAAFTALDKVAEKARADAIREFRDLKYVGRASDDLARIAQAAIQGGIRKIMVASDQTVFGQMDRKTGTLTLHHEKKLPVSDDLLDDLAEVVMAKGGKVICMPHRELPTASPAAAVFSA